MGNTIEDIVNFFNHLEYTKKLTLQELSAFSRDKIKAKIHLAILNQPYIDYIISGKKTIESRFMKVRQPPFGKIKEDDIVIMKETGGKIIGLFEVGQVVFCQFDAKASESMIETQDFIFSKSAHLVLSKFQEELQIDDNFIQSKINSKFATLMYVRNPIALKNIDLEKTDRRAWVIL